MEGGAEGGTEVGRKNRRDGRDRERTSKMEGRGEK